MGPQNLEGDLKFIAATVCQCPLTSRSLIWGRGGGLQRCEALTPSYVSRGDPWGTGSLGAAEACDAVAPPDTHKVSGGLKSPECDPIH